MQTPSDSAEAQENASEDYMLFAFAPGNTETFTAANALRERGHPVIIVENGIEALDVIKNRGQLPSILYAELMMEKMDGWELMLVFRRDYPKATTRVLFATNMLANGEAFYDWNLPIDSYILKPFKPWQIVLSIEQFLYRDVRRREE